MLQLSPAIARATAAPAGSLRIAVFIDHDIFVRHFLHSGVLRDLFARHAVDVIVPPEGHRRLATDPAPYTAGARLRRLMPHRERHRLWARLLQVTVMRPFFDASSRELRRVWRLVLPIKGEMLFTLLGTPGLYSAFVRWTLSRVAATDNAPLDELLSEGYDLAIIPGTPDSPFQLDVLHACNRRRLPCIMIMNSWDNPSGNRLVSGMPDLYLVWGEQTRQLAVEFLRIPSERVIPFGAAQFDVFATRPRLDRAELCSRHGIDPSRRILLYAGGSLGTNEFADLEVLDEAVERGRLGATTLIYRPHPWGVSSEQGKRILERDWRHVRLEATTAGHLRRVASEGYSIHLADYRDTHDLLANVDAVISPLSTILIEAMMHRKPTACFLPIDDVEARHFQAVHDMRHFREIQTDGRICVAKGRSELVGVCQRLLALVGRPELEREIGDFSRYFVAEFDEPYAARLAALVESFAASHCQKAATL
jgi:hypothetical protein